MIVRKRPSVWTLFFIKRGSIFPIIMWRLLAITLLSAAVVALYDFGHLPWFESLSAVPFSLLGIALSIFLGFRNNACYDRWWEARKHWGELIVQMRSNARESVALFKPETARELVYLNIAFTHALGSHLRDQATLEALAKWLSPQQQSVLAERQNLPDALLQLLQKAYRDALKQNQISDINYRGLTERLDTLASVQTACERIRTTPTPFAYSLLLHRTAWVFCLLLPFSLVSTLGTLTPLLVVAIAYTYFGLDALGEQLEEPFSLTENSLPLAAMTRTVERSLLEALNEPVPDALLPQHYLLS